MIINHSYIKIIIKPPLSLTLDRTSTKFCCQPKFVCNECGQYICVLCCVVDNNENIEIKC